jgi:hypothetical protein
MLVRTLVREKTIFFVGISPTHPIPGDKYWFVEKMHDILAGWWGKLPGMQNLL